MTPLPSRILIFGQGRREFALGTALAALPEVEHIVCTAPACWERGPKWRTTPHSYDPASHAQMYELAQYALKEHIGLVVVGPEAPLALDIEGACRAWGVPVLAPSLACVRLEMSKIFCKSFCLDAGIPTAKAFIITYPELRTQLMIGAIRLPCVVKYDGFAAGKGVFVLQREEDVRFCAHILETHLGAWERQNSAFHTMSYSRQRGEPCFLIEDMLEGEELSVMALCNGAQFRLLSTAQEHLLEQIQEIFSKTLAHLMKKNTPYHGFLFVKFMVDRAQKIWTLGYNCCLDDAQAQVVLSGLEHDFFAALYRTAQHKSWDEEDH